MKVFNSNKGLGLEDLFIQCQSEKLGAIYINQKLFNEIVNNEPKWFDPCASLAMMKKYSFSNVLFTGWITDDTKWKCEVYKII